MLATATTATVRHQRWAVPVDLHPGPSIDLLRTRISFMFKGMGNLGNLASMMGSLKQLPDRLKELNERMKTETVTATSGGALVTVEMNGVGHVQSIQISDELTGEALEEAILEATNAAGAAAKQMYADAVSQLARELNLNVPGIDGLLSTLTGQG